MNINTGYTGFFMLLPYTHARMSKYIEKYCVACVFLTFNPQTDFNANSVIGEGATFCPPMKDSLTTVKPESDVQ